MKQFWFQLIGLAVVILVATFLAFNQKILSPLTGQLTKPAVQTQPQKLLKQLKIVDKSGNTKARIDIELADDKDTRSRGLGFRESLATDSGMYFIHETSQKYTYWMKGMKFPIDIMWISGDEIVDLIGNIPPPVAGQSDDTLERYSSLLPVDRVLETNAGFIQTNNIKTGDKIILETNTP